MPTFVPNWKSMFFNFDVCQIGQTYIEAKSSAHERMQKFEQEWHQHIAHTEAETTTIRISDVSRSFESTSFPSKNGDIK